MNQRDNRFYREPDGWRETDFPKDREIMLRIDLSVPAYWDDSIGAWVLSYPLNIETVHRPYAWKPLEPRHESKGENEHAGQNDDLPAR